MLLNGAAGADRWLWGLNAPFRSCAPEQRARAAWRGREEAQQAVPIRQIIACRATLRRFLSPTHCRLRFVARLFRKTLSRLLSASPISTQMKRAFQLSSASTIAIATGIFGSPLCFRSVSASTTPAATCGTP